MKNLKGFALASCVGLFGTMVAPALYADEWNKKTVLTVNESIQVPNKVLQPGKYVMKLLDSPSNRHIVQIFDENEQHLITTVLAIPNWRLQPTGDTRFGFWETPAGQPKALRSWFYPGDNFGQEFAYPKNEAMQIAATVNQPVPTTYAQSEADLTTARVATVDQAGKETPMETAQATTTGRSTPQSTTTGQSTPQSTAQAAATPAVTQEADRAATPAQDAQVPRSTPRATPTATAAEATPQSLPHTASPYPLIGLLGVLALAAYAVTTVAAKRSA